MFGELRGFMMASNDAISYGGKNASGLSSKWSFLLNLCNVPYA